MVEQVVDTSLVNVVVRKVLESSVADFVVAAFVLDLISAIFVDGYALCLAESKLFAGFELADGFVAGGLNVTNHVIRKNCLVRIPFFDTLVVMDLHVQRKDHLLAGRHALEGVFVEKQGLDGASGKVDGFVFVLVFIFIAARFLYDLVKVFVIFVFLDDEVPVELDIFLFFQGVQLVERNLHQQLGLVFIKNTAGAAVRKFNGDFPVLVFAGEDLVGNFEDSFTGLVLNFLFGKGLAEQQEHVVAEVGISRMEGAGGVAVNTEGLAHVNVFAHLDLDILGIPVEKM